MKNNVKFNCFSFKNSTLLIIIGFLAFLFTLILAFGGFNTNIKTAHAAITAGDTSTLGGQITSDTFSHTVGSGNNRLLIVSATLVDINSDKEIESVTFNGQSLQQFGNFEGPDLRVQVFRMIDPPETTSEIEVTIKGGQSNKVAVGAVTLFGVDQVTPLENFVTNSGDKESISLNVSSESGDLVMDHVGTDKNLNSPGSEQTQRWVAEAEPDKESGVSTEPGDTSVTMSWGTAPGKFSHVGWNINAASLQECEDGIDNDGDGQIDYPDDSGCEFPADNDETDPGRGGSSESTKIRYSGFAYPNGTVTFHMEDENGNTCQNIEEAFYRAGENARFDQTFNLCFKEVPILGIQATDSEGRTTNLSITNRSYYGNTYYAENIVFPPTVSFDTNTSVLQGEDVIVSGSAVPDSEIEIVIDGVFTESLKADEQGAWSFEIDTDEFRLGDHSVRARITDPRQSTFSKLGIFYVHGSSLGRSDLNNDSVLDIRDISIFLFRWGQGDDIIRETIDFNEDGLVDIKDLSIFLRSFSN